MSIYWNSAHLTEKKLYLLFYFPHCCSAVIFIVRNSTTKETVKTKKQYCTTIRIKGLLYLISIGTLIDIYKQITVTSLPVYTYLSSLWLQQLSAIQKKYAQLEIIKTFIKNYLQTLASGNLKRTERYFNTLVILIVSLE